MKRMIGAGLGLLLTLCLSSCFGSLWPDDCGDCPGDAHWEYTCVGWIAPVCDNYCVTTASGAVRVLEECCCSDKARPDPQATAWRSMTSRYE